MNNRVVCFLLVLLMAAGALFANGQQEGAAGDAAVSAADELAGKKVSVALWFPPNNRCWDLYKDIYMEHFGGEVEYAKIDLHNQLAEQLSAAIAAGTPYDIVPMHTGTFYTLVGKKLVQPVDPYIDMNDELWQSEYFESLSWEGNHYALAYAPYNDNNFMFYNKDLIAEYGLEDPYELYQRGEWDWDHFLAIAKELTVDNDGDGELDQWGYANWSWKDFVTANNGQPVLKKADGTFELNLEDPAFANAVEFYRIINKEEKIMAPTRDEFTNGKIGICSGPAWYSKGTIPNADFEIGVVAFAKGPDADTHYNQGQAKAWAIGAEALNPLGAAKWAEIMYNTDFFFVKDEMENFNTAQLRALKLDVFPYNKVGDYEGVISLDHIHNAVLGENMSFSSAVAKYKPVFEGQIEELLASMK